VRTFSDEFIEKVTAIIDRHDTRQEAHSIEDALMRDAERAWRFDRFGQTPDFYTGRFEDEIIPELNTEAAIEMARTDLKRSRDRLKNGGAPMTTQQLTRKTLEIPYRHVTTHFIVDAWREVQDGTKPRALQTVMRRKNLGSRSLMNGLMHSPN
jgi:hypothetical protein